MVVVIVLKLAQFRFQILVGPKERQVQALAPYGANQSFHKRMGEWRIGRGFDFLHYEYSQIGLPLVEPEQRIIIRTEVFRNWLIPNRLLEHPA